MREAYTILFPLGAVIGALGVGHWLLYTFGVLDEYNGQGHALAQIQAFLTAFACGFLLTMIPRRTKTPPPSSTLLAIVSLLLSAIALCALLGFWVPAELGFLVLLAILVVFIRSRRREESSPPSGFVLVPLGLLSGAIGAVLIVLQSLNVLGVWALALGRGLIQEGMFLCLVLGIGVLLFETLMGYRGLPDAESASEAPPRGLLVLGVLLLLTFPLEAWLDGSYGLVVARRVAYGLRTAVVLAALLFWLRAYRRPRVAGLHRWFMWIGLWMLPLGLWLAAAMPRIKVAMLHVVFIGGFSLLVFVISTQVRAIHAGRPEITFARPWQVWTFGVLVLFAMTTRVSAVFLPESYWIHIGAAAALWLLAIVAWQLLIPPRVAGPTPKDAKSP